MTQALSEKGLELAYDACQKRLDSQDTTLGNLRSRANTLLASAALFISFSSGVGLIHASDPTRGPALDPSHAKLLVGIVVALAVSVLSVQLPTRKWAYGPQPEVIMTKYQAQWTETGIRFEIVKKMITDIDLNEKKLVRRAWAFRGAALLLMVEAALLLSMLTL
jgi:hypothetical protein